MNMKQKITLVLLGAICMAGTACAQKQENAKGQVDASTQEVMGSPQVKSAMAGAMQILKQMDAENGGTQAGDGNARSVGQSAAMQDAMSVAAQAFGFAAQNPNASEGEKQAAANRMMDGIFQRELNGGVEAPGATRQADTGGKDYGQDADGGN